jgi:triacylglycerol lipase
VHESVITELIVRHLSITKVTVMPDFKFDSKQTKWSGNNALACAMASELAYSYGATIAATAKKWGYPQSVFLDRRETQGFVASNSDMILVAFRGTEPKKLLDWMTDADIALTDFLGGKVHAGFLRALENIWDDLTSAIAALQTNSQSVWITGHSLGAALATLAAARFRLQFAKPVYGIYTYGSPRVGNTEFQMRFNQLCQLTTFRYVNNADAVTRVPLRETSYRHIGTFVYFNANGAIESDVHWWNQFVDSVTGDVEGFLTGKVAALNDHSMKNYVARCKSNLPINPF